jgi:hypothetical protein
VGITEVPQSVKTMRGFFIIVNLMYYVELTLSLYTHSMRSSRLYEIFF